MSEKNDNEFNTFGFLTSKMRSGFVTAIVAILMIVNVVQWRENRSLNQQITTMQTEWKNEVVKEVRAQLRPIRESVNEATAKISTTTSNVDSLLVKKGAEK